MQSPGQICKSESVLESWHFLSVYIQLLPDSRKALV